MLAAEWIFGSDLGAEEFRNKAVFELVNHQPGLIQQGSSKIVTESALALHTKPLLPGYTDGLEIYFSKKPMTESARIDILRNNARELKKGDFAAFVLFLQNERTVGQVNLSYVVPGTTVARTVAWQPDDLKNYFLNFEFDGKRLRWKSNGSYTESDKEKRGSSLSWDIDLDLPVFEAVNK